MGKRWSRDKAYEVYLAKQLRPLFKSHFIDVECAVGVRGDTLEKCVHVQVSCGPYTISPITNNTVLKRVGEGEQIVYRKMFSADDMEHVTHRVITAMRLLL